MLTPRYNESKGLIVLQGDIGRDLVTDMIKKDYISVTHRFEVEALFSKDRAIRKLEKFANSVISEPRGVIALVDEQGIDNNVLLGPKPYYLKGNLYFLKEGSFETK